GLVRAPVVLPGVERRRSVLRPVRVPDRRHPAGQPRGTALFPGLLRAPRLPHLPSVLRLAAGLPDRAHRRAALFRGASAVLALLRAGAGVVLRGLRPEL